MPIHEDYVCHCTNPSPFKHLSEDTGLCGACNGVYDERLYEMRLRQHVANFTYDTVDEYLKANDPHYRALTSHV